MDRIRNPPLPTRTHGFARQLRAQATDAENNLWYHLRAGRMQGLKWRRQHPVPPYIVDFYCHRLRLVVEIEGGQHGDDTERARDEMLLRRGLKVLRFWDHEVLREMDNVLEAIWNAASDRTLSPTPLPEGEGNSKRRDR